MNIAREIELAWAAGFFDGEGSTSRIPTGRRGLNAYAGYEVRMMVFQNADAGAIPDVLLRLQRALDVGRIVGPYSDNPRRMSFSPARRPRFLWHARGEEVTTAIALLWPHLGSVKREQATTALAGGAIVRVA